MAVAVVKASGYSSDWIPGLEISICQGYGPKKQKTKIKKKGGRAVVSNHFFQASKKKQFYLYRRSCYGTIGSVASLEHWDASLILGLAQ